MDIRLYKCWFREHGILGGLRVAFYNQIRKRFSINGREDKMISVYMKSINSKVCFRPYSTDLLLMHRFFWGEGPLQYDIDFTGKIDKVKYIVDAGANIGLFSLLYKSKYPEASIVAIEPETSNFSVLKKNSKYVEGMKCINAGVWKKDCFLEVLDGKDGAWSFTVHEVDSDKNGAMPGLSIPSIMEKSDFPEIDILKMDIEGSEYVLFEDDKLDEWINFVKILIIEIHKDMSNGNPDLIEDKMLERGYEMEVVDEDIVFWKK